MVEGTADFEDRASSRISPPPPHRRTAFLISGVFSLAGVGAASLFLRYLEPSAPRTALALLALGGGSLAGVFAHAIVRRLPDRRGARIAAGLVAAALFLAPLPISARLRCIPAARFGLTVYGMIPVPALDITVDRRGSLGLRRKSHRITREEIEALLAPGVEVVVIGDGWDRAAKVDPEVFELSDRVEIRVLSTPEAFAAFEALSRERRGRVVLLAHTTC